MDKYWVNSGKNDLIDQLLLSDEVEIQEDLQTLLKNQSITKKIHTQVTLDQVREESQENNDIFYSLLVFTGYLNPKSINGNLGDSWYNLTIPNEEVKQIYEDRLVQWITRKIGIQKLEYDNLIKLLLSQKIKEFEIKLRQYVLTASSFFQTDKRKAEVFYSGLILGLVSIVRLVYIIESEPESGKGRADLVLTPKPEKLNDTAFIIEYKVCDEESELEKTADIGMQQIDDRCYDVRFEQRSWVKKVTKVALAFCGKEVFCKDKTEVVKRES